MHMKLLQLKWKRLAVPFPFQMINTPPTKRPDSEENQPISLNRLWRLISKCLILKTVGNKSRLKMSCAVWAGRKKNEIIHNSDCYWCLQSCGEVCICNIAITEEETFGALKVKCWLWSCSYSNEPPQGHVWKRAFKMDTVNSTTDHLMWWRLHYLRRALYPRMNEGLQGPHAVYSAATFSEIKQTAAPTLPVSVITKCFIKLTFYQIHSGFDLYNFFFVCILVCMLYSLELITSKISEIVLKKEMRT